MGCLLCLDTPPAAGVSDVLKSHTARGARGAKGAPELGFCKIRGRRRSGLPFSFPQVVGHRPGLLMERYVPSNLLFLGAGALWMCLLQRRYGIDQITLGASGLLLTHATGSSAAVVVAVPTGTPGSPVARALWCLRSARKHVRSPAMGPRLTLGDLRPCPNICRT